MAAIRTASRRLTSQVAPRAPAVVPAIRLASTSTTTATTPATDSKSKASSLLDALPGNSIVSKTGWVTLGTAVTGAAISNEIYVLNEETVVLGGFIVFVGYLSTLVRKPYTEWANAYIEKVKNTLNASRAEHTDAVRSRINSVSEMKDVVATTKDLYAMSRETAELEHEAFILKQQTAVRDEAKSVLDAWVRAEAQQREAEQAELVKTVKANVEKLLSDAKFQKDILTHAVTEVELLVKDKKI